MKTHSDQKSSRLVRSLSVVLLTTSTLVGISFSTNICYAQQSAASTPSTTTSNSNQQQGSQNTNNSSNSGNTPGELTTAGIITALVATIAPTITVLQFLSDRSENKRRRLKVVQDIFTKASAHKPIKNVVSILNYNPNKIFEIPLGDGQGSVSETISVERLTRALRTPEEIVKINRGIDAINSSAVNEHLEEKAALKKFLTELKVEFSIRNWFNEYIEFLIEIERHISAKLFLAKDAKAYLLSWIQPIADQRNWSETLDYWSETSTLYEQLFSYMYNSGPSFKQAENLFERYKYKIPPLELFNYDISDFGQVGDSRDTDRALWLAKAARLMYGDYEYIKKNIQLWLDEDISAALQSTSDKDYVINLLKRWHKSDEPQQPILIEENFKSVESKQTGTQAFLFRKGKHIVLIFRGSQDIRNWAVSSKLRLVPFNASSNLEVQLPSGRVHSGFQLAWISVEKMVLKSLGEWWTDNCQLWVTGHGLGGALANLAGVSLDYQGYKVSGIYTFGQPRVADFRFMRQVNQRMGNRIFRYVNNNDVVTMVPPPFSLLDPIHLYSHIGQQIYFNAFGKDVKRQRLIFLNKFIGVLLSIPTLGRSLISDHNMGAYIKNIQTTLIEEYQRETKKSLISVTIKLVSSVINR